MPWVPVPMALMYPLHMSTITIRRRLQKADYNNKVDYFFAPQRNASNYILVEFMFKQQGRYLSLYKTSFNPPRST